jgi:hypothetical protein
MPIIQIEPPDLPNLLRPADSALTPPLDRLEINENMDEDQKDLESLTPEKANLILHSHRKVRYGKLVAPHGHQIGLQPPFFIDTGHQLNVCRDGVLAL